MSMLAIGFGLHPGNPPNFFHQIPPPVKTTSSNKGLFKDPRDVELDMDFGGVEDQTQVQPVRILEVSYFRGKMAPGK